MTSRLPMSGTDPTPGKPRADAQAKLAEVGCPSSDDAVLARVLRRFLTEPDDWGHRPYCDAEPGDQSCTLDGRVALLPGEAEVLHRLSSVGTEPTQQIVLVETTE